MKKIRHPSGGEKMNPLRTLLLTILALFSASQLRAQDDVTHVNIRNDGNVKFAVATAAKLADFPSGYTWEDKVWFWVSLESVDRSSITTIARLSGWRLHSQTRRVCGVGLKSNRSPTVGKGVFQIPSSIEYDPYEYQGGLYHR
jgi:hypothetical protein